MSSFPFSSRYISPLALDITRRKSQGLHEQLPIHDRKKHATSGPEDPEGVPEEERALPEAGGLPVEPDGQERNTKKVVGEDERVGDEAAEQAHGVVGDAVAEVGEAAALQLGELGAAGGEEGVQRHGQHVDDGRQALAAPVEGVHGAADGGRVAEVRDARGG